MCRCACGVGCVGAAVCKIRTPRALPALVCRRPSRIASCICKRAGIPPPSLHVRRFPPGAMRHSDCCQCSALLLLDWAEVHSHFLPACCSLAQNPSQLQQPPITSLMQLTVDSEACMCGSSRVSGGAPLPAKQLTGPSNRRVPARKRSTRAMCRRMRPPPGQRAHAPRVRTRGRHCLIRWTSARQQ